MAHIEAKSGRILKWLFSPSIYVAGWQALYVGLFAILSAGYAGSFSNAHFDGVMDFHVGMPAPLWFFLSAGLIDWLCMAGVLLVLGRIASNKSFRVIDVLGTQAMARWPTVLSAIVVIPEGFARFNEYLIWKAIGQGLPVDFSPVDATVFGVAIVVTLLILCWMVRLMYSGYAISCNLKGWKAIVTFIVGLVIAEAVSKTLIVTLARIITVET